MQANEQPIVWNKYVVFYLFWHVSHLTSYHSYQVSLKNPINTEEEERNLMKFEKTDLISNIYAL